MQWTNNIQGNKVKQHNNMIVSIVGINWRKKRFYVPKSLHGTTQLHGTKRLHGTFHLHSSIVRSIGPARVASSAIRWSRLGSRPLTWFRLWAVATGLGPRFGTVSPAPWPRLGPVTPSPGPGSGTPPPGPRPGSAATTPTPTTATTVATVRSVVFCVLDAQLAAVELSTVERVNGVLCVMLAEISDETKSTIFSSSVILWYVHVPDLPVLGEEVFDVVDVSSVADSVDLQADHVSGVRRRAATRHFDCRFISCRSESSNISMPGSTWSTLRVELIPSTSKMSWYASMVSSTGKIGSASPW